MLQTLRDPGAYRIGGSRRRVGWLRARVLLPVSASKGGRMYYGLGGVLLLIVLILLLTGRL
jgi:hypothetical protein